VFRSQAHECGRRDERSADHQLHQVSDHSDRDSDNDHDSVDHAEQLPDTFSYEISVIYSDHDSDDHNHTDRHTILDADSVADSNGYTFGYPVVNGDTDRIVYAGNFDDTDRYAYAHRISIGYSECDGYQYGHTIGYANRYGDTERNCDAYNHSYADKHTDSKLHAK
jgi:hypothetical protein